MLVVHTFRKKNIRIIHQLQYMFTWTKTTVDQLIIKQVVFELCGTRMVCFLSHS